MSGSSSVPRPTFGPAGVVLPAELDVLAGVLTDTNAAFGGKLNVTNLQTSQGQLATTWTAAVADKNAMFLYFVQMIDPTYSEGRMQDAIAKLYFLTRQPSRPTIVAAVCRGLPGTYLPLGSLAQALDGTLYASLSDGVIGADGTLALSFAATTAGPITCPAGTLLRPYQVVPGWDSLSNPADGALGTLVESAADFELRRALSVAINGQGGITNVRGAVLNVDGVLDAYVTDNPTGAAITVNGVTLPANSLYVCVAGGLDADVAQAIFTKKSPGVTMFGNTTVAVLDATYDDPKPSYAITFQRAAPVSIYVAVTLTATPDVPSNAMALVSAAVVAAFTTSASRARIGGLVYAGRLFTALAALGPWAADVIDVQVGTSSPPTGKTVQFLANQIAAISPSNVTLMLV